MNKNNSNSYLGIKNSALLLLNNLNINPTIDNNLDKMYRRIMRMIHLNKIPFRKVGQRYFLNRMDIELLGVKIKEEAEISNPFVKNQKRIPTSSVHSPPLQSLEHLESPIEKIDNIIKLYHDKTISAKQALIIINKIIRNYKN
jgi:hypothetical protein